MPQPKAIVVQLGARRQYAVPYALARTQSLEMLYTDFCMGVGLGRFAPLLQLVPFFRRTDLSRRHIDPPVRELTRTFPRWMIDMQIALRVFSDQEARLRAVDRAHEAAGRSMVKAGFGKATHIVSMFGEGRKFLVEARNRGLTVATDMNIALSTEAIVQNEQRKFPDWEQKPLYFGETGHNARSVRRASDIILGSTDIFLCPSEFVKNDLIENFGVAEKRTRLVPYSVHPRWFNVQNVPELGRILFVGNADLRKGIHILADAATLLRSRGKKYSFIVAGTVSDSVRGRDETRHLTFIGKCGSDRLIKEYSRADVFVLPSLAEGSAGVTYEALGAGLPVVTTFESGSIVRHGHEGFVVPAGNAEGLADMVEALVEDRAMRSRMAAAARARAQSFDWGDFSIRLNNALFGRG
ncbi:glycosyltransferase family 4 protein [Mesorhizobium sp. M0601]|uniref:glycosyltransferase family 4 protein n=1 Tax=Mesorhizobium sp. M0601 TaxID=2956969 RepID=UPI00333BFE34